MDRADAGYRLTLDDDSALLVDVVLSAVGLRPRTALAQAAGLAVKRGILVDDHARSSAEAVYALGDCAEYASGVMPYVMPIMTAARALAQTLTGKPAPVLFPPMPVSIKTPVWPIAVQPIPRGTPGEWRLLENGDGVKMVFNGEKDRLLGFALTGPKAAERSALTRRLLA